MQANLSIIKLITEASLLVQIVIAILLLASIVSWALIFIKNSQLNKARSGARVFEKQFWSGVSLQRLFDDMKNKRPHTGLELVFYNGYQEFKRFNHKDIGTGLLAKEPVVEASHRAMRIAEARELDQLEHHLSFLATVGSTSPYIGLFGTVWGIMNSFLAIGQMKQATLAVVAPGIAEALIATAIGLFAAIPAVIAYNKFIDSVERLAIIHETFREEFVALLDRHVQSQVRKPLS